MNTSIREELLPTSEEKIVTALLKEFIGNNPLEFPYTINKEIVNNAVEKFKEITAKLPPSLNVLKFE